MRASRGWVFEPEFCAQKPDLTPCAVCHHSRPRRRLWTFPAVLDIFISHSPRSATQQLCQMSRLRSRMSSRYLDVRDHIELAGHRRRSQSRLLTLLLTFGDVYLTRSLGGCKWAGFVSSICDRTPACRALAVFDDFEAFL